MPLGPTSYRKLKLSIACVHSLFLGACLPMAAYPGFFTCSIAGKNPSSRGSGSKYLLTAITARASQGDRTLQVR